MNKFPKISGKGPFFELDGRKQTAVKSMVEDDLTDEQIGKLVERTDRSIRNWKNDELFITAKEQYLKITENRAFDKLSKIHNDVARLVFKHDLTNSENAKINETFLDK